MTHVLLLGDPALSLIPAIERAGDTFDTHSDVIEGSVFMGLDYSHLISYGYRHKIRETVLNSYPRRAINLHMSYLPWNRGAHPNFWSWIDNTPKGVTLHFMDNGIDTGPIIARRSVALNGAMTFRTSYNALHDAALSLFSDAWPLIRSSDVGAEPQDQSAGSRHLVKDLDPRWLPNGWDTPIEDASLAYTSHCIQ